jgi:predicted nucleic acid-binding protein
VAGVLVDSNVLLDVLTENPKWYPWSADALERAAESEVLIINALIYAEVSVRFARVEDLDAALPPEFFRRDTPPWEAGFLAGECFRNHRRAGGARRSPLPDFYVGAHAAIRGHALLTRDATRYRTYFPTLELIAP